MNKKSILLFDLLLIWFDFLNLRKKDSLPFECSKENIPSIKIILIKQPFYLKLFNFPAKRSLISSTFFFISKYWILSLFLINI